MPVSWLALLTGGSTGLWVAGGAAAIALSAIGVQTYRLGDAEKDLAEARAEWAAKEADLSRRALEAEQRERQKEQDWARLQKEIRDATIDRLSEADAAASAADAAARGLRERVQALAAAGRRTCGHPAAAGRGASAPDQIGVLADVLGRADAAAGVLAAEADRRRAAGIACEQSYDALTAKPPRP